MREKFSISETARLLGIDRGTIRRWINRGLIPPPIAEDTAGARLRYWDRDGFTKIKEYKDKHLGEGRGRRTDIKKKRAKENK
jgi:DNA-binding transcriptional MerR regulator